MRKPILKEGLNCWRTLRADDAWVLVDGDAYFENLYWNLRRARRSILILGWDIDSRQSLLPGRRVVDGMPVRLGEYLDRLARDNPRLDVHVLCWNFAPIYMLGRESFQTIKLGWQTHERIRFRFDAEHPVSGSHHQKIVVIDDQLVYCGGLDLTASRWDTSRHEARDAWRILPSGLPYGPFHDVQLAMRGAPAAALGDLARERWRRATGETLPRPEALPSSTRFLMPEDRFEGARVGIARTVPPFKDYLEIREVERLCLDLIESAERYLYIENQYFTSNVIRSAVVRSLGRAEGPEIVMILPKSQDSWLSQNTMGTLSSVAINQVRAQDPYGRLKVYYPDDSRLTGTDYINVHAKVMVADDCYLRIGSANMNNRSMGLDTECDVVIDAVHDAVARDRIRRTVAFLAAHHCGAEGRTIQEIWRATGSLAAAIDRCSAQGPKRLVPYVCPKELKPIQSLLADLEVIDPEKPVTVDRMIDDFVFRGKSEGDLTFLERIPTGFTLTFCACLLLAVVRLLTPLSPVLRQETMERAAHAMGLGGPLELWFFVGFVALGFLCVPLNLLIALTAVIFRTGEALLVVAAGSAALAASGYAVGRRTGRATLRKILDKPLYYLRQAVVRHSTLGVFLVRFFPIAPFMLMNVAAGSSGVAPRPYFVGTLLGLLPGAVGIVVFLRSLLRAIDEPGVGTVLRFLLVVAAFAAVYFGLSRRLGRTGATRVEGDGAAGSRARAGFAS